MIFFHGLGRRQRNYKKRDFQEIQGPQSLDQQQQQHQPQEEENEPDETGNGIVVVEERPRSQPQEGSLTKAGTIVAELLATTVVVVSNHPPSPACKKVKISEALPSSAATRVTNSNMAWRYHHASAAAPPPVAAAAAAAAESCNEDWTMVTAAPSKEESTTTKDNDDDHDDNDSYPLMDFSKNDISTLSMDSNTSMDNNVNTAKPSDGPKERDDNSLVLMAAPATPGSAATFSSSPTGTNESASYNSTSQRGRSFITFPGRDHRNLLLSKSTLPAYFPDPFELSAARSMTSISNNNNNKSSNQEINEPCSSQAEEEEKEIETSRVLLDDGSLKGVVVVGNAARSAISTLDRPDHSKVPARTSDHDAAVIVTITEQDEDVHYLKDSFGSNPAAAADCRSFLGQDEPQEDDAAADDDPARHGGSQNPRLFRWWSNVGIRRCVECSLSLSSSSSVDGGGNNLKPATVYCYECNRCLCEACDNRRHDTTALDQLQRPLCSHRVEYIIHGGGLPILSPLLELAVLATLAKAIGPLWTHAGTLLSVEYFFSSTCPLVDQVRRAVFSIDHALYPLVRGSLGEWCDVEDGFVKIFSDLWVRSILTHTDSMALLLMKLPSIMGALLVYLAILPLLAIPYAMLATLVRGMEVSLIPNVAVTRFVAQLIRLSSWIIWLPFRLLGWFCRSTALGLVMDQDFKEYFHRRSKIPPSTGARKRPTPSYRIRDWQWVGSTTRITRVFGYFHRKARRAIIAAIVTSVFCAMTLRIVLLSLPRCGRGLLSSFAEQEMWQLLTLKEEGESSPPPSCFSIDIVARKFAERVGVAIPEFSSLGAEGQVLAKMQQATENDYLDETLRRIGATAVDYIGTWPWQVQAVAGMTFCLAFFAGLVRRLIFWMDLHQRYRYHRLQRKGEECIEMVPEAAH